MGHLHSISRKWKKDTRYNGRKKKNLQWSTKNCTVNIQFGVPLYKADLYCLCPLVYLHPKIVLLLFSFPIF